MQHCLAGFAWNGYRRALFFAIAASFFSSVLHAQEVCTAEIKLLIAPSAIDSATAALKFDNKETGRVYFFDTDNLALLSRGVIVRVRQGAKNDLTVKVRLPQEHDPAAIAKLREHFGCEIDRTAAEANTSFSVGQKYKDHRIPKTGQEIFAALNSRQQKLLREVNASIDWSEVKRIAEINSTTWKGSALPEFPSLTMEFWEWPSGRILELSARAEPAQAQSKFADLQQMASARGLSSSDSQGTKTASVLKAFILAEPQE